MSKRLHESSWLLMAIIPWLICGIPIPSSAKAEPLIVDLSSSLIAITSSYSGAKVVLFGAQMEAGDVVIVVRGPRLPQVVRHKTRIGGVWVNSSEEIFEEAPGFYAILATGRLENIAEPEVLSQHQIGVDQIRFTPVIPSDSADTGLYQAALIRNRQRELLYQVSIDEITYIDDTLFRAHIEIPAHAPVGLYWVHFYLFRDGKLITKRSRALTIRQVGFERTMIDYAHEQPAAYGVIAVLLAVVAGWLANFVFRRV